MTARTPGSPHPGQASDADVTLFSAGVSQYWLFPHRAGEVAPLETGQHPGRGERLGGRCSLRAACAESARRSKPKATLCREARVTPAPSSLPREAGLALRTPAHRDC